MIFRNLTILFFLVFEFLRCSGQEGTTTTRNAGYVSTTIPVYGPQTSVATTTSTTKTTSTIGTSTSITTNNIGLTLLDNTPVSPLQLSGGQIYSADQPANCPNTVCLVTPASSVLSASATYTSITTNTSTVTSFTQTAAPIRNYFKTVCIVTQIVDRYQPIFWEGCATVSGEAFFVELAGDGVHYLIHPASQHALCMEAAGTPVHALELNLNICTGSAGQLWSFDSSSGTYSFIHPSANNSLCLVRGGDSGGNQVLGLYTCDVNNTMLMWEPGL